MNYLERLDAFKRAFRERQRPTRERLSVRCTYDDATYPIVFNYLHTPEAKLACLRADWHGLVRHIG